MEVVVTVLEVSVAELFSFGEEQAVTGREEDAAPRSNKYLFSVEVGVLGVFKPSLSEPTFLLKKLKIK